jgi:putative membrane protein
VIALREGDGRRLRPVLGRWLVAAVALTAWDLFLDPQMVGEGYWVWMADGIYQGIPWTNYLGWFVSALVVLAVADRIVARVGSTGEAIDRTPRPGKRAERRAGRSSAVTASLPLLCLFTWWAVMEAVGFLAFFGDPLVGIVGGVAMGVPAALAWRTPADRVNGADGRGDRADRADSRDDRAGPASGWGDRASAPDRRGAGATFPAEVGEPSAPVPNG